MNFKIIDENKNSVVSLNEQKEGDLTFVNVNVKFSAPTVPQPLKILWYFSAADCTSTWNPSHSGMRGLAFEWGKFKCKSRLASWMPVQSLLSKEGLNKLLIAVSDVDTPIEIGTGLREENAFIACEVKFFTVPVAPKTEYTATIRLDTRNIPYYDSIYDTVLWWENECGYTPSYVPESAKEPMDSLWYSFHQELSFEEILKECKASKEIGLKTVIIDDGWQTDDNNRGYGFCGDWKLAASKIPDMKVLTDEIHKLGMKVILWYSVPFVGIYSEKYEEFKGYYLDGCGNEDNSFALDPRYKKVRDYLVETYKDAVLNWNLDGLKLDFIDSFKLKGESLKPDDKRDYSSLEDGIHALLSEVKECLTKINPEIMIEFRQSYVGPSIRKYGNMLRVSDCPCDVLENRFGIVNLRLTSGKTAVHSDMIMWNSADTAENAALQFTSVIYSVPQISVRVWELPEEHLKMLKHYIDFWYQNKDVLLNGKLVALNPEYHYSLVKSTLGEKEIITPYTYTVVEVTKKETIAVNSSMQKSLIIKNAKGKKYKVTDCMGNLTCKGIIKTDLEELVVPVAGIIYINSVSSDT